MDTEQSSLLNTALKLGLPVEDTKQNVLNETEISERLGQVAPYLALRRALVCQKDGEHSLLAEVRFGPNTCDGHYPGSPSIPLVDMGRAMNQAAAATFNGQTGIPLLRRIAKLRAESMEVAHPDNPYWVWVTKERGEIVSHLYSSASGNMLATIQGWEYDFATMPVVSKTPQFGALQNPLVALEFQWMESFHHDQITKLIPQAPPFLVLQSARRGRTASGVTSRSDKPVPPVIMMRSTC